MAKSQSSRAAHDTKDGNRKERYQTKKPPACLTSLRSEHACQQIAPPHPLTAHVAGYTGATKCQHWDLGERDWRGWNCFLWSPLSMQVSHSENVLEGFVFILPVPVLWVLYCCYDWKHDTYACSFQFVSWVLTRQNIHETNIRNQRKREHLVYRNITI